MVNCVGSLSTQFDFMQILIAVGAGVIDSNRTRSLLENTDHTAIN